MKTPSEHKSVAMLVKVAANPRLMYRLDFGWCNAHRGYVSHQAAGTSLVLYDKRRSSHRAVKTADSADRRRLLRKKWLRPIKDLLAEDYARQRQWVAEFVARGPLAAEKPGWVYVYARERDVQRQRATGLHVILHKVGFTTRQRPLKRISEQAEANREGYVAVLLLPTKWPKYFERACHEYLARHRVCKYKRHVLTSGGTEWFAVEQRAVVRALLRLQRLMRYVWGDHALA